HLMDDADTIAKKIRKARTDPEPLPHGVDGLAERPEARNLVGIYAALSDCRAEDVLRDHAGAEFSRFKGRLTDLCVEKLGPIGAEMKRLTADPAYVEGILADGAARARAIAAPVLADVYDVVGFIRPR
ncbi:MAG: tryptophan--tRNA ligase, partial [Alphaproteobacteria bacterium]